MKILLLSTNNFSGAGIATKKIYETLKRNNIDCDFKFLINAQDNSLNSKLKINLLKLKLKINKFICILFGKKIKEFQSLSLFPTNLAKEINKSKYDIIHLTWINEFLSIKDIGNIKKPIVWTLCDMWPIGGVSHYDINKANSTFSLKSENNNILDKWIIKKKINLWKNKIHFVAPSKWLLNSCKKSIVSKKFSHSLIPWPINQNIYKKRDKNKLREKYKIPKNVKIALFNSFSGIYNKRKGWDLLKEAITKTKTNFELIIIGNGKNFIIEKQINKKIYWMGVIKDEDKLAEIINCADIFLLPSRMDNLPQSGLEAQSCGLPIVTFNCNGLKDLVDHKTNGYLARPYDTNSFARGIDWAFFKISSNKFFFKSVLKKAKNWDSNLIYKSYLKLYSEILHNKN